MRKFYKVRTLAIFFASSFDSLNCRPPTDVKDRASMIVINFSTGTQQISSQSDHLYYLLGYDGCINLICTSLFYLSTSQTIPIH